MPGPRAFRRRPLLLCHPVSPHTVGRGLDPSAARRGRRPLQRWPETIPHPRTLPPPVGAGHARPLRGAEGCAGVGWFRAIFVGGGVLDVPRRGQDPSLRCGVRRGGKAVTGGGGKRAGRACPAPAGWRKGERVLVGGIIGLLTAVRASISGCGARGGRSGPGSCRGRGRSRSGCGPRKSVDG